MFTIPQSIDFLERTPNILNDLLLNLPEELVKLNEGGETWSPFDVVGHLIHGERSHWIERLEIILSDKEEKTFSPFDRFAQFMESQGKSLNDLLLEFKTLRERNIKIIKSKNISVKDFDRIAVHPTLGKVTLKNLIHAWVVHDLNHLTQIERVISYQIRNDVGPWKENLRILK